MDEPHRKFVEAWLIKARNDLATAHKLASGTDPYLDTAIYHTQQAAEKALKGFLTFHHQQMVKTHDIRFLLGKAILIEDRLSAFLDQAERLTPYATAFRYPDEDLEPDWDEFDQALAAAEEIYAAILASLPVIVHPSLWLF